ncbi:MAG: c-type cytochrome [Deltaproteobacteria bacterium]|jgi:cytochrome c oxidase cbb3-type subunit 3|nr:c-type cytochrome [Deltaproteobacteria bacterium]
MSKETENESGKNLIFESEKAILLNHNYDGIQEFDHPLPKWWLVTFYGTMIFAAIYVGYFHFGSGLNQEAELESDIAAIQKLAPPPASTDDLTAKAIAFMTDEAAKAAGKVAYLGKCAACHGNLGEGGIGPNLSDAFWIHGDGQAAGVVKVIVEGVAEKGMPTWGAVLPADEIAQLTAFIATFKGTSPPNPKAPEGVEIK